MDMSSQIAFERSWNKANRLPEEQRAIAPVGEVAYAHDLAEGEARNRAAAFQSDMAFREESREEKGREFGLSTEEKNRQVLADLDRRYTQSVQEVNERERQFGGRLAFSSERAEKELEESGRQFGVKLSTSKSQFDTRLAAEKEIFERNLAESLYESRSLRGQKATQFERSLAFRAQSFDDEMEWMREKFRQTLSFNDLVFADKMTRERRDLDTWILSNRIGAVIQLGNTISSAYGMGQGIKARMAQNAELKSAAAAVETQGFNRGVDAAANTMINEANAAYDTEKYEYDPDWQTKGKYFISEPDEFGNARLIPFHEFRKNYNKMQIPQWTAATQGRQFLSP